MPSAVRRALIAWPFPRDPATWLAVTACALALGLPLTQTWHGVEQRILDRFIATQTLDTTASPVVIVGIDEASFAEVGRQWPWPRDLHAKLVGRLHEAGAAVIGLDMLFAEATADSEEDRRLAEAIRGSGRVVLGADEEVTRTAHVLQYTRIDPVEALARAAAVTGLVGVPLDPDAVVRRLPSEAGSFWRGVLRVAGRTWREPPHLGYLRFADPERGFAYASYYQALDPPGFLPAGFFRDRIVLVGLNVRTSPDPGARLADRFATPLLSRTGRLMAGVEIQAAALLTVLQGRAVGMTPWGGQVALALATVIVAAWGLRAWQPARGAIIVGAIVTALGVGSWAALQRLDLWVPVGAPALATVTLYVGQGALAFVREQALRRRIRQAFAHYVSPHVVDEMIAHPERLRLGGERRALTLLFADLAGFTSLAERLPPEAVVHMLNRCLTEVTRVIVEHGGTVDKFMGDAVMALWGAPVADPDHGLHACQAARGMQEALATVRGELEREGLPGITMRVGIHSGEATVGNMGSDTLFDYTAVGDDVNLAARLEGANKACGTTVLISAATVAMLAGGVGTRPVDRIRVKGRAQAVEVFTLEDDPVVERLTRAVIDAYRARRWDEVARTARELLQERSDDAVGLLYLARAERFGAAPPPPDWDGVETLDTK